VPDTVLQQRVQRIGEIVEQLESASDPRARAVAKELVESLMALHGAGLERILEIAADSGAAGESLIRKCAHDELVSSLLLLYGLHPENLSTRVTRALEKLRNHLETHGAKVDGVSISDDGAVAVHLRLESEGGCGSRATSLKSTVEAALQDAAPDASAILVKEIAALTGPGFIPVTQLAGAPSLSASFAARPARSGE
jgi:Fe-S cluster biogenesis protein NfuA